MQLLWFHVSCCRYKKHVPVVVATFTGCWEKLSKFKSPNVLLASSIVWKSPKVLFCCLWTSNNILSKNISSRLQIGRHTVIQGVWDTCHSFGFVSAPFWRFVALRLVWFWVHSVSRLKTPCHILDSREQICHSLLRHHFFSLVTVPHPILFHSSAFPLNFPSTLIDCLL